jgi:GAF domain-containing protein
VGDDTATSRQMDPADAYAALAQVVLGEQSLSSVLDTVAALAARTIPGARAVSVTLIGDGKPNTVAHTGRTALELDESQYEAGHGPCLQAATTGTVLVVDDTTAEPRWPKFADAAVANGVRSSASIPLPVQQRVVGALNLYATEPRAFDDDTVTLGQTFAGYAAVALANTQLYATTAALAEQMAQAMSSRAVIEQAKGILMGQRGCTADEAFRILVHASQTSHRKLHAVAQALVDNAGKST